jgi:DNA-binding GntR family transcriptional regulator
MKQKSAPPPPRPSRLQRDLLPRIVALIRAEGLTRGARLTELALADRLQVSRTPVRAALAHLADRGVLRRRESGGFVLARAPEQVAALRLPRPDAAEDDRLSLAIARDRLAGVLREQVSETDLMRRYNVTRPTVQRLLGRLAEVALVERRPGHGWMFLPSFENVSARAESYRFRLLIEPAGLLEPTYRLDPAWLADMRVRHREMLSTPWRDTRSIALFEMNAAFHEGLAAASGNRYMLYAIQQQNRLRRFSQYDWVHGHERVVVSCTEHLEILDRLEAGDRELAALLLRRHLERASRLSTSIQAAA